MAVALTAAVGYDEAVLPVNGNIPGPWVVPFNAMLDSEVVTVITGGLTFWEVLRGQLNTQQQGHASGAILFPFSQSPSFADSAAYVAATLPREQIPETATVVCTSTHIGMQAIWLSAGMVAANISICTSAGAAGTPLNFAIGLYDILGNCCCSSADQTTTPMAAQILYKYAMVTPYTVANSGIYYVAIGSVATTVPTLKGIARTDGTLAGTAPSLNGVSSTTYASGALPATVVPVAAGVTTKSWWAAVS